MPDELNVEIRDKAMIVRFTRPEVRNPLSVTVLDNLHLVLDDLLMQPEIEGLIFTGTDASFASGADLREIAAVTPESASGFARYGQEFIQRVAGLDIKTFAAVNGFCFGGALDLALACDFRIATPNAKFAHPGTGLGIITGWGGTQRLPRLIGQSNALEMFFTAEPIDAQRALEIGLIDCIADDPVAESLAKLTLVASS